MAKPAKKFSIVREEDEEPDRDLRSRPKRIVLWTVVVLEVVALLVELTIWLWLLLR